VTEDVNLYKVCSVGKFRHLHFHVNGSLIAMACCICGLKMDEFLSSNGG
jgi:hypothetical protein